MGKRVSGSVRAGEPDPAQDYYAIHAVLRLQPDLPFWLVRWDGSAILRWMEINEHPERLLPYHFEIHYGKQARRDAHYLRLMRQATRQEGPVVGTLFGFSDLFLHLQRQGREQLFLHAGQFLSEPLDWARLGASWRALTGKQPASANPDFARYARMAADQPVVEGELLACVAEFSRLYGDYLVSDRPAADWAKRVERLRQALVVASPSRGWIPLAVDADTVRLLPWHLEGRLARWMREEMGICRLPTTAIAVMPLDPAGQALDVVQALVRNRALVRACVGLCRDLPETACTALGDYGVLFLTSTDPRRTRVHQRLELRDRVIRIQRFIRRGFRTNAVAGIGRSVPPGEPLHPSHREAVLALHLCVQSQKTYLFADELPASGRSAGFLTVHQATAKLVEAGESTSREDLGVAADVVVREVLIYCSERLELVRSQLLGAAYALLAHGQRRQLLGGENFEEFASEISTPLEEVSTLHELIEAFKSSVERLSLVLSRPRDGSKTVRVAWVLRHVGESFAEPVTLPEIARRAGFSVAAFSRAFREVSGTSFLAHLRSVRVEHAKLLLRTTELTVEQVAQSSGFHSSHHLIRAFKLVTGERPSAYRQRVADRAEDE